MKEERKQEKEKEREKHFKLLILKQFSLCQHFTCFFPPLFLPLQSSQTCLTSTLRAEEQSWALMLHSGSAQLLVGRKINPQPFLLTKSHAQDGSAWLHGTAGDSRREEAALCHSQSSITAATPQTYTLVSNLKYRGAWIWDHPFGAWKPHKLGKIYFF